MKREKLKLTHYVALTVTFAAVYKMWNMFSSDFFDELDGQSFKGNWESAIENLIILTARICHAGWSTDKTKFVEYKLQGSSWNLDKHKSLILR